MRLKKQEAVEWGVLLRGGDVRGTLRGIRNHHRGMGKGGKIVELATPENARKKFHFVSGGGGGKGEGTGAKGSGDATHGVRGSSARP